MKLSRRQAIRIGVWSAILLVPTLGPYSCMIAMPGSSHSGPLPPLTAEQGALSAGLRRDVVQLSETIGVRNLLHYPALKKAADYIEGELKVAGAVRRQTYSVDGKAVDNLEVELRGASAPEEIVIVGAHYDSVFRCPGANDNGSGTAGLLALARALAGSKPARTLRLVAFVNEEPPQFRTADMGSRVYANRCRSRKENVVAMLSLETIGYYTDAPDTQRYPPPLNLVYPSQGNFIAFVGNLGSRSLVRRCVRVFRDRAAFPSEGAALPSGLQGVGWSDHESFWEAGTDAIMVTDTAPFRYPHYHAGEDTPDKLDYDRCARAVAGVAEVVRDLAGIAR
jgi:Zn-dependent M28 family amino/carboxypeptidase